MGKNFILILIVFVFAYLFPQQLWAEYKQTKIVVLDFQLQGTEFANQDLGKIVAEWLVTAMVKDGRFEVIERRLLTKILAEHQLAMTGIVNPDQIQKIGKILGAEVLISGAVMQVGTLLEVNTRIIDIETGSIIAAERVKSDTVTSLEDMVVSVAAQVMKDFPLKGYVAKREKDKVVIDLGRQAGVKKGMQFIVYQEGKVIKHPKTGEILEIEKLEVGRVEVFSVSDTIAWATIIRENVAHAITYGHMIQGATKNVLPEQDLLTRKVEIFENKNGKSFLSQATDNVLTWTYQISKTDDDTYAGFNINITPQSMQDRIVKVEVTSQGGIPLFLRLYSFVQGYSQRDDDETFVPVEAYMNLKPGSQTVTLEPSQLSVPEWWREEYDGKVPFAPDDIRMLEFEAEVDEDIGPLSDKLIIHSITLQ